MPNYLPIPQSVERRILMTEREKLNISDLKSHDQVSQERKEVDAEYKALAERALATVEEILDLQPIEGADRLELATVRGWNVVVRKGEFSVAERVVYFEIDSFLDVEKPVFAFLKDRGVKAMNDPADERKKVYGHALRTIKLRGQISQGLVLPLEEAIPVAGHVYYENGQDITDELGVLKYEPYYNPSTGQRQISTFPFKYAVKSDAERVQNLGRKFDRLKAIDGWNATLKLDGCSVTFWKDEEGTLRVATRNYEIDSSNTDLKPVQWMVKNIDFLEEYMLPGEAMQGELYGEGIQGNPQRIKGLQFSVFNYFINGQIAPARSWRATELGYLSVPSLSLEFPETIADAVSQAYDLRQTANPDLQAEGIVWHNDSPEVAKLLGRNCWKAINDKFLLSQKD